MILYSGFPFWLMKNGYLFSYPSLSKNITTDVLIIGAGISGALTGHKPVNSGVNVVLVDKRMPGMGSTCASTSLLQYEIDLSLNDLSKQHGRENATAAYLLCLDAIYQPKRISEKLKIDCGFQLKKSIYLASEKSEVNRLKLEFEARKKIGIRVNYLNQKDLRKNFSLHAPGGLLSYDAGQMDSYKFTHGLLQDIIRRGGNIFSQTEIKKINYRKAGVEVITENGNKISAKKIVMAIGYESLLLIDPPLTTLHSTFAVVSEPIEKNTIDYLLWETARPYFYLRATDDNRIIIGGKDENFIDSEKRNSLHEKKSKALIRTFQKKFPSLKFKPAFEWCGTFADTKDGLPYIGSHVKFPHTYFALGFGGNGITFSQIAAEIIYDLFLQKKNTYAEIFSFTR